MSCLWKIGYKGADCWTLEANKEKRPTSYHGRENTETKNNRFTGNCHYCHKKGHQESECRTKQNDNANNAEEEHALMTSYCTHKEDAMYDLQKCSDIKIDTANGSKPSVTHIRKYKGNVLCGNGKTKKIVMKNVKVLPGLVKNLFSLST